MRMKVSDYIAQKLVDEGITDAFMVTGGGAMHLDDGLGHQPGLHCYFNHHEQACAIAAEAYARIHNKIAALCVTTGPGGTNAITGVVGGWLDSIPMLVLSGQVRYDTTAHSNVSIIKDGVFKTHPTDHYILPGITRMHIIQICKDNGIIVDETPFTMAELMDADEIIVSSSTKFCSPACEMNGTPIGGKAPELVDLIQKKYTEKFENETM